MKIRHAVTHNSNIFQFCFQKARTSTGGIKAFSFQQATFTLTRFLFFTTDRNPLLHCYPEYGARGDGNTDDSDAIQAAIDANRNGKVIFFPHGAYVVSKTIKIPGGTRMTGEIWSIILATGNAFGDWNNPTPVLRVGDPGEVGSVEISEFMFSTKGPCPGAVLVQWNIKGSAPGAAGIWDSHFRVGGFAGSNLQGATCPRGQGYVPQCVGAFILLHVTTTGSGLFENVWAWTADHDLDAGVGQGQVIFFFSIAIHPVVD